MRPVSVIHLCKVRREACLCSIHLCRVTCEACFCSTFMQGETWGLSLNYIYAGWDVRPVSIVHLCRVRREACHCSTFMQGDMWSLFCSTFMQSETWELSLKYIYAGWDVRPVCSTFMRGEMWNLRYFIPPIDILTGWAMNGGGGGGGKVMGPSCGFMYSY